MSRFPAAFRPPTFASWSSLARWGLGLPCGRLTGSNEPGPNGIVTLHTHEKRPGWVPSSPRGLRCPHDRHRSPVVACRFSTASPYPSTTAHHRGSTSRGIIKGSISFTRPVFPLACNPRVERASLGLIPELHTPPCRPACRGGGQAIGHSPELCHRHQLALLSA